MSSLTVDDRKLAQCRFEVQQATRLRASTKSERKTLYSEVYDSYAEHFPEALADNGHNKTIAYETAFLKQFITPDTIIAEIGPGRCGLSFALAPLVRQVYGIDVASALANDEATPANFKLLICDGIHIPLADNSVDIVISKELVEHLHPDDAAEQVAEAYRILKPGGRYLCGTPNRLIGPHDCSNISPEYPCEVADNMYVANGLHLREYTNSSLADLFLATGFRQAVPYVGARGHYRRMSFHMVTAWEAQIKRIPVAWRSRSRSLRVLLGVRMMAIK